MINKSRKRTIVIGRSGTGKSTCAILKMLAIDLLFIGRKVLKLKKNKVDASDLVPTGIRNLFLTSSRVLADDLRAFYEKMWNALKEKLLGREMKSKATVQDVVDLVDQMEADPEKFVNSIKIEPHKKIQPNEGENPDDMVESVSPDKDTTQDELDGFKEVGETNEGGDSANQKEQADAISASNQDTADQDDFELDAAESEGAEKLGNNEIYKMMQKSLDEIEKKLENYNFRGDQLDEHSSKKDSSFPIFSTVLDFYQKAQFTLGGKSLFMTEPRFKLNEASTIKQVGFNEYLDNYSGRKFQEINSEIAKKFMSMGFAMDSYEVSAFNDRYFRLIDSNVFEKEFVPAIPEYIKNIALLTKAFKENDWYEAYECTNSYFRPIEFVGKCQQERDAAHKLKMNTYNITSKDQSRNFMGWHVTPNANFLYHRDFKEELGSLAPSVLWSMINNRPSESVSDLTEDYRKQQKFAQAFLLHVFDLWKSSNYGFELRDLAYLGNFRPTVDFSKKRFWYWHQCIDGTELKAWSEYNQNVKMVQQEVRENNYLTIFEMDFVYLDEIQDVNIAIIQDLDRLAKHGFVGFGDNA